MASPSRELYRAAEQRIGRLTLLLGLAAAAAVWPLVSASAAAGVAAGAALAWMNARWLREALDSLVAAAVSQHDSVERGRRPRFPFRVGAKLIGRYILMAVAVYVIVKFFDVPVLSVLAGLLALGAATMVEGIYEAFARP